MNTTKNRPILTCTYKQTKYNDQHNVMTYGRLLYVIELIEELKINTTLSEQFQHFFVLCCLCCQFLWIFHFLLPLQHSLTFIEVIYGPTMIMSCKCFAHACKTSSLTYYLTNSVITKDAIILNIKYSWHRNWHMHNKNVDIKFSAHDAFQELPSSGTLKIERLEWQII